MKNFPCGKCCELDLSCCHNPQITWNIEEFDNLVTARPEILQEIVILKAEMPGLIYILDKETTSNPDANNSIGLNYCKFYDTDKNCCDVYEHRPAVCKTYGDPKYNSCPYEGFSANELQELNTRDSELATRMHKTAGNNPEVFGNEFILPFVERFLASDPEYIKWWEGLPTANFVRN